MRSTSLLLAAGLFFAPAVTRAVVLAGGNGSQNFTNPGAGLPWDNVGTVGSGTGVYLGNYGGNYWAITAQHIGPGNLTLGGNTFNMVPGSAVRVLNDDASVTDLVLFRVATDPGLATLSLATAAPPTSSTVQLVGRGRIETGNQLFWLDGGGAWQPLPDSSGANRSGYNTATGGSIRWGNAFVTALDQSYDVGTGETTAFRTTFVATGGYGQGEAGDSGGAIFFLNGGNWYLAGIMGAVGKFTNQPFLPVATAVFGDATFGADIATYGSFISSAIPEPNHVALGCAAAAAAFAAWRRRRRA